MPSGYVASEPTGKSVWLHTEPVADRSTRARDVRWGDFLNLQGADENGWRRIKWGEETFFIESVHVTGERPLEIIFVDVGQGDGCIIVSPETGERERVLIVDAGEGDNMFRFVRWRFGKLRSAFRFHAAVLTHSDLDHYGGFGPLFEHENVAFDRVYHNGLAERPGDELFGASDATRKFLVELAATHADMESLFPDEASLGRKKYPKLMHAALNGGRVGEIVMLSATHGDRESGCCWMPGFAPSAGRKCTIEVLGPVPESLPSGATGLRWFDGRDEGMTKNGHSVLLRLVIGDLRILLGGDLNRPAEEYLLRHYGGIGDEVPLSAAVAPAAARLGADILKCCHHGSADVTDEFLRAVDPFAFVVSSGDEESHAHPRPDLLGRLGKNGRGAAPLILCTEIFRSTREKGKTEDFARLRALDRRIDAASTSDEVRSASQAERKALQDHIQRRNVGVYGAITMRTDGHRLEITYRLEQPRDRKLWQSYVYAREHGEWRAIGSSH